MQNNPLLTPFSKVLVANRGEIAVRVMRSARALGYATVAVHSTVDADSPHVLAADQAVCIGEALPAESYLRIDRIIDAARASGADAIHPGYGFLAENEDFAAACKQAGIVFIGPSAEAITAMGNKAGAKRMMIAAGVPCIPGYEGEDQSPGKLAAEAERIGFPVMIKATAGGGGRGMRLVESAADFATALQSARSEARSAFGDDAVILERAIRNPRHIEIQIMADRHGNAIHLGERDCSVQRRHQKVIEEAPSPAVSAELRARMGETAVRAVRALAYEGAGTLEFLLDEAGSYYFMEMNTRLQVEHPVTECITGLDLVDLQLRVAAGEPLPITQEQVRFEGHAIEVRVCAEDPGQQFMPQSGTLAVWQPPQDLRVEHALRSGSEIPPCYDSMVAKIIAHGRTREEARRKLANGLRQTVALGVPTNLGFLQQCLAHPAFIAGAATTAFIGQHQQELLAPGADAGAGAASARAASDAPLLKALAALLTVIIEGDGDAIVAASPGQHRLAVASRFMLDGKPHEARLRRDASGTHRCEWLEGQEAVAVELQVEARHGVLRVLHRGIAQSLAAHRRGEHLWFQLDGRVHAVRDLRLASATAADGGRNDGRIKAQMTGRVVAIHVAAGDRVEAGQPVLTLEAMKMEHIHTAPVAGVVKSLQAQIGDQLASGRLVAEIEKMTDDKA